MPWIIPAIRTALGIGGSFNGILAAIGAAIAAFLIYTNWIKHEAAKDAVIGVIEDTRKTAGDADAKSEKARADASKPGALDRLRADPKSCRDCGPGRETKAVPKLAASNDKQK